MNDFQRELNVFKEKITTASVLISELSQSNETLLNAKAKIDQIDSLLEAIEKRHQLLINEFKLDSSDLIKQTDENWQLKMGKVEKDFFGLKDFYLDQKNEIITAIKSSAVENDNDFSSIKIALADVFSLENAGHELVQRNTDEINIRIGNLLPLLEDIKKYEKDISAEIYNSNISILKHMELQDNNQLEENETIVRGFESLEPKFQEIFGIQRENNSNLSDSTHKITMHLTQQDSRNEASVVELKERVSNSLRQVTASIARTSEKISNQTTDHNEITQKNFLDLATRIDSNQQKTTEEMNGKFDEIMIKMNQQKKFFIYLISLELLVVMGLIAYLIFAK